MLQEKESGCKLAMDGKPMIRAAARSAAATEGATVTRASLRAAARLSLPQAVLGRVIGVSEASVSRMSAGAYILAPGDKPFELAVLFVRLFRSLDAMVGGDESVARAWLRQPNVVLGAEPLTLIQSVTGLVQVVAYLDAHRARI
jgi:hypothetical protein